jgi:hypothetical protein
MGIQTSLQELVEYLESASRARKAWAPRQELS